MPRARPRPVPTPEVDRFYETLRATKRERDEVFGGVNLRIADILSRAQRGSRPDAVEARKSAAG